MTASAATSHTLSDARRRLCYSIVCDIILLDFVGCSEVASKLELDRGKRPRHLPLRLAAFVG